MPEEKSVAYKQLFKEASAARGDDSAIEARWQAVSHQTADAASAEMKEVGVAFKVDSWHSARMVAREVARMATKHVAYNALSIGFGTVTKQNLQEWHGAVEIIVAYRSPPLTDAPLAHEITERRMVYKEFDVYAGMVDWLKAEIVRRNAEEAKRRDPVFRHHKEFAETVVSAALGMP